MYKINMLFKGVYMSLGTLAIFPEKIIKKCSSVWLIWPIIYPKMSGVQHFLCDGKKIQQIWVPPIVTDKAIGINVLVYVKHEYLLIILQQEFIS